MPRKKDEEKEDKKYTKKFLISAVLSIFVLPCILYFFPTSVPFRFFELWKVEGHFLQWIQSALPLFLWGAGVTILLSIFTFNEPDHNRDAETIMAGGVIISIFAGVVEEIFFRWLFFLLHIIFVKISNFLFFGFLGFGIAEWLYVHFFGPIANWATLHSLQEYLFHPSGWAVGTAMLSTNAFFRDGHKYLGLLGFVNSWFIGMYCFWIMFHYGLLAAIIVHFLYDLLLFVIRYLDMVIERSLGWV